MSQHMRRLGPVRCGTSGEIGWMRVEFLVEALAPVTSEDWSVLAAWIVDGDVAGAA